MKYAIFGFFMSGTLLWPVRVTVDGAAAEEGRAASENDKDYKAAREEHSLACEAVKRASAAYKAAQLDDSNDAQLNQACNDALDNFQKSIAMMNRAATKMEETKPVRGMDRVHWRKLTRIMYCASLLFLVGGALCANIAFFLSLESEIGCVDKVAYYIPLASPALLVAVISIHLFIVGMFSL